MYLTSYYLLMCYSEVGKVPGQAKYGKYGLYLPHELANRFVTCLS